MIIVIDIGNTNIKIGVYDGEILKNSWRMATDVSKTADEYGVTLKNLLADRNVSPESIKGGILSSVIPQLNYTIEHMLSYHFNIRPLTVGAGIKTGLNIKYENPKELGSDRIVNSVACVKKYGAPCIVVDFGTATTYNVINGDGEFAGGCITLGVKSSVEALANSTAKLPRVELMRCSTAIGKTTVKNIQNGLYFSVVGQVNAIIKKIRQEINAPDATVVATGGLSELFLDDCDIDVVDRGLSLDGLKYLYYLNCADGAM
ncbi:MAG: type III pantothenate kinase [Clostridia bacterium]|nr:type III pantothenate kinase [Clostridia bacterium]